MDPENLLSAEANFLATGTLASLDWFESSGGFDWTAADKEPDTLKANTMALR